MQIISRDYVMGEKAKRREKIKELEYHAHGDCIHVGKISRGCSSCFVRNNYSTHAVYTGCECNVACGYCYYEKNRTDESWNSSQEVRNGLAELYRKILNPETNFREISFNSFGETLMYPGVIKEAASLIMGWEENNNKRVYKHLYTNGILADRDMLEMLKLCRIDELRFHISASDFSSEVLNNMLLAKNMGFVVTVEEPSLPENREKLLKHLDIFNTIGIKHLNIDECQVTKFNIEYLDEKCPNGRIYRDRLWHFYDEGMVYDIIEEVIKKDYSFSVIDCNSRVECCRDTNQITAVPKLLDWNMMDSAIADFE